MRQGTFKMRSPFAPAGDQPRAIEELSDGLARGFRHQTLFGVTGSGKTFTMANVIAHAKKPALVIAHNKTLAAQLAQEYREFFPDNAVHYFVSYYDYYQPEAYLPVTDTYIEKEAEINEEIDRLRHASTQALLTRRDVIIVASVSCIYGLGSPEEYERENLKLETGMRLARGDLLRALVSRHFTRTNADLSPGMFRAVGGSVEVMPGNERVVYRIELSGDGVSGIRRIDPVSYKDLGSSAAFFLFPAKHFVTSREQSRAACRSIKKELTERLAELERGGKALEAERLRRRTRYDLALIAEVGYTNGIENYSRHFDGRLPGEPPNTLLSYFPERADGAPDFLTVIDESHVTVPQLAGMYAGDRSRKETLIEHGFRLPSARDNRPLTFPEFMERVGSIIYTSATPGAHERKESSRIVEQIIRPTGLVDPAIVLRPAQAKGAYGGQVQDFIGEARRAIAAGGRVIATTLTKRMAEDLSEYLAELGLATRYLHSDVETLERIKVLTDFRRGKADGGFDCLVGVNLLREGLDLPEVTLIGIFDADREGFLRSQTSLIQIIGRAARNTEGRVILYADRMTGSMDAAIKETNRRRDIQLQYNKERGITPKTIEKRIRDITETMESEHARAVSTLLSIDKKRYERDPRAVISEKLRQMSDAVKRLDFETAALLRDEIRALEGKAPGPAGKRVRGKPARRRR